MGEGWGIRGRDWAPPGNKETHIVHDVAARPIQFCLRLVYRQLPESEKVKISRNRFILGN